MAPRISTICITRNEEHNIERCLRSVASFSDEIIVVDSQSDDRTVELAQPMATRVISRKWPGYGPQKQFALEQCSGDWIFSIDADEEASQHLQNEILSLDFRHDGYTTPRRVWYLDRWITRSGWYPGRILRLFRRERGRFTEDQVHESVLVEGQIGRLDGDLYHYSYRDIAHHIEKINEFTSLSAQQMFDAGRRSRLIHMAVTPHLEFLKVYVARRGFMDGGAGLIISILHASYVFTKYAKLWELHQGSR